MLIIAEDYLGVEDDFCIEKLDASKCDSSRLVLRQALHNDTRLDNFSIDFAEYCHTIDNRHVAIAFSGRIAKIPTQYFHIVWIFWCYNFFQHVFGKVDAYSF